MREVAPLTVYQLFKGNMLSRYGWDVEGSGSFDPEAPKPVFILRKSYAQLAPSTIARAVKKAVISKK